MRIYVVIKEWTEDSTNDIQTEVYLHRDYEHALRDYENIKFEMENFWREHYEEGDYEINENGDEFVIYLWDDYHYNHESVRITCQYLQD